MTDITLPQAVNRLDRLEQVVLDQAIRLDTVILAIADVSQTIANIPQLEERNRRRHQQHDLELDDHDERMEAIERLLIANDQRHQEHEKSIGELKEIQTDVKSMLAILMTRFSGETNE